MSEERDAMYPVQAAARLTGLSPDTLRAWERRYGAVVPRRTGRGRAYSREDIARLRLLRTAVQHGHGIGTIAPLSNEDVAALLKPDNGRVVPRSAESAPIEALLNAVRSYDVTLAEQEFSRLAAALSPAALVLEVVQPVLRVIGDEWQRGTFRPGQEHMLSGIIRHVLGGLLRVMSSSTPERRVLFATLPGERHEFGILSAALLAAANGVGVVYLGIDLPADEIAEAALRARVNLVVVGLTAMPRAEARRHLEDLRKRLPAGIAVWVGGAAAQRVRGVQVIESLEAFAQDLGGAGSVRQTSRA